jgi:hypothetical protein
MKTFEEWYEEKPVALRIQLHKPASEYAEEGWNAALAACAEEVRREKGLYSDGVDHLLEMLARRFQRPGEMGAMFRCDQCDNGITPGLDCPFCGASAESQGVVSEEPVIIVEAQAPAPEVVDLMEALRASLKTSRPGIKP